MTIRTTSPEQTQSLGMSLAAQLRPGDVLLLGGELGAGKTVLARGIVRGLGTQGPVASPTFTLLNTYEGRLTLHHMDLYRLDSAEEFFAAGLGDTLDGSAAVLIEWPCRAEEAMPEAHLAIDIAYGGAQDERLVTITPRGGFREVTL